jgi:hypothetical protein
MRALLTILLLSYTPASVPQMTELEWWQKLGEPCSTRIDRLEGTCGELNIKSEIIWK